MSGGSYDYFYQKLDHVAGQVARSRAWGDDSRLALRKAFAAHLEKCAAALRAIEWNDSGDGDSTEIAKIEACIGKGAELAQLIDDARSAKSELQAAIERAEQSK
jgi:hypothetical protein